MIFFFNLFHVVVCLPRPLEGMGWLQFSDLLTELPVLPQAAGVVGIFNVLFIINYSLRTTVSFLDLKDVKLFLQGLLFPFLCVHFHSFCKYTLHVHYVFNVIWRILLMADGLNAVWSHDRAAHTDTNPKNLELAYPHSVTPTMLDQLV